MVTLRLIRIAIPTVILAVVFFYYHIPPQDTLWIPKCPWWMLTGTYCPSCGVQRCLHLILNGHILQACVLNPFLMLAIPYAVLVVVGRWYNFQNVFDPMNRVLYSRPVLVLYVCLYLGWWAIRIVFHV